MQCHAAGTSVGLLNGRLIIKLSTCLLGDMTFTAESRVGTAALDSFLDAKAQ